MTVQNVTGKSACIQGWNCVRKWQATIIGGDTAGACSATAGGVVRGAGNSDFKLVAVGYGATPPVMPNDLFTFDGYDVNGSGWQSSTNGAICEKIRVICPVLTGKFIYWEVHAAATGSLTTVTGAGSSGDTSSPNPLSAKGLGVTLGSTAQDGIIHWELELDGQCTDPEWQSNSVVDADSNVWPVRGPGNIDGFARWVQNISASTVLPKINSFNIVKLFTTATLNWQMKWGEILEDPVIYDIEGKAGKAEFIKAAGVTAAFSGWNAAAQGNILKPGPITWWGTP